MYAGSGSHAKTKAKNTNHPTKAFKICHSIAQLARASGYFNKNALVILDCNTINTVDSTQNNSKQDIKDYLKELFTYNDSIRLKKKKSITTLPHFNRLEAQELKLYVAQYILQTQQKDNLVSVPFTFRLPLHLHSIEIGKVSDPLQQLITKKLKKKKLLWWFTLESSSKTTDHIHGEIILEKSEVKLFAQILRSYFKRYNAICCHKIILTHTSKRKRLSLQHGQNKAAFGWVQYSTKQIAEKRYSDLKIWLKTRELPKPEKKIYISSQLSKLSSDYYNNNIRRLPFNK